MLELLIGYQSQENPEVQLLQDEQNGKLYLVGGKTDKPIQAGPHSCSFAKLNLAKIFIDLSPFEEMAEINIYEEIPEMYAGGGNNIKVCKEASEVVLITVLDFKECKIRMLGSSLMRYISG